MILLYAALILCLVAAQFFINRRVARLEKKFIRTADEADRLVAETAPQNGARNEPILIAGVPAAKKTQVQVREVKTDPAQLAKRQYLLGVVVQKRDRLEEKHQAWERRQDRLNGVIARVRAWKGRKLPYTFGVLDVASVMYVIDRYGLHEYLSADRLMELVNQVIAG